MKTFITKSVPRVSAAVLAAGFITTPALAHPGHDGGFADGILHPLTGLDHLAAMVAVGLWAATRPAARAWQAPVLFVAMLAVGALAGVAGGAFAPMDTMAALSVTLLGLMLIVAPLLPDAAGLGLIALFALVHGYAHGMEAGGHLLGYFAGFMVASALLHAAGWRLGGGLLATRWGRLASGLTLGVAGLALAAL
ncbi:HupE/UreJ family protein [Nitrospirillum sp. BR 11828]|uniref:HupE/UreJ family protein n=1 Tax=Nitrospirillum sp. BR 11828 TaxID=3104325 RepID=UPI002ACAE1EF|nr:HupE/UreJ family protein [Nitrospirillum sp. BR 11828]MDZ5649936.1 HupE/UreJ family protein [Nitrospirillum sp. BR 11828]